MRMKKGTKLRTIAHLVAYKCARCRHTALYALHTSRTEYSQWILLLAGCDQREKEREREAD